MTGNMPWRGVSSDGSSQDVVQELVERLRALIPDAFGDGNIDFDVIREALGDYVDNGPERYRFTWNGKSRARRIAQTPSTAALRPCPDESVGWDTTQNLFIEGDNLEALKLLQKSYHQRVKMIYIDPPYNTGRDFIYRDRYQDPLDTYLRYTGQIDGAGWKLSANSESSGRYHTNWLNLMYPRLKLARHLLRDDGLIFISIDDCEVRNLRSICDEIFGEENFVDTIIWKKRYGGGAKEKFLVSVHEYILMYAKDLTALPKIYIPLTQETIKRYYTQTDANSATRGPYRTHPLEAMKSFDERSNLRFPVTAPDGSELWPQRQWRWGPERMAAAVEGGEVEFVRDKDGNWTLHSKQYLKDQHGQLRPGKPLSLIDDVFTQHGTNEIVKIFGNAKVFEFPKPSELIRQLIQLGTRPDTSDVVLDFFAGSAATAHATLKMNAEDGGNRRFVMVQLPEPCGAKSAALQAGLATIADIGRERIRRAAETLRQQGNHGQPGDPVDRVLDLGFRSLRLDSTNVQCWQADVERVEESLLSAIETIKAGRTELDVVYELILKYGLDLSVPVDTREIGHATVFVVGGGTLVACLSDEITLEVVEAIAELRNELQPDVMRVVCQDAGFRDDATKTNAIQILRQRGVEDVKCL